MASTRNAEITGFFGDAPHVFRIGIAEAEELQELLDCGLMPTLERVTDINVRAIRQVLRVGLVGGGMRKERAFFHVEQHLQPAYLIDAANLAGRVVRAALQGAPDEPSGEPVGEGMTAAPLSQEASSATPISTAQAPPSGSRRRKSAAAASGSSGPPSQAGNARTPRRAKTTTS